MVYSVRSDRPMIATKPLKRTRKRNANHEEMKEFLNSHRVHFVPKDDASGEMVAVVEEISSK